jgi:hypothetical protein
MHSALGLFLLFVFVIIAGMAIGCLILLTEGDSNER